MNKLIIFEYEKGELHVFDYPFDIDNHREVRAQFKKHSEEGLIASSFEECDYMLSEKLVININ